MNWITTIWSNYIVNSNWFYIWWIPLVIANYVTYYWISIKNNEDQLLGNSWYTSKWFWIMFSMSAVQVWLFVSRFTSRMVFDGLLYDMIIVLVFPISMMIFGQTVHLNKLQWIGLIIVVFGFILLRLDNNALLLMGKK